MGILQRYLTSFLPSIAAAVPSSSSPSSFPTTTLLLLLVATLLLLGVATAVAFAVLASKRGNLGVVVVAGAGGGAREPQRIRHWVPFVGHGIAFLRDQRGFFEWASKKADHEPFSILLSGEIYHIFSHPSDVSAIYRHASTITETRDGMTVFRRNILGFGPRDAETIADLRGEEAKLHAVHLLGSEELGLSVERFVAELDIGLRGLARKVEELERTKVGDGMGGGTALKRDAFAWVGEVLMAATVDMMFGRETFRGYEDLFGDFRMFMSERFFLRSLGLPECLAKRPVAGRERIKDRLRQMIRRFEAEEGREDGSGEGDASRYIRQRVAVLGEKGLSREGVVANEFDIIIGANLNSIPMAYLTLLHLLASPPLLAQMESELTTASWRTLTPTSRAALLPNALPRLQALFREVMRYHTTAWSAREVHSATTLHLRPITADPSPRIFELQAGSVIAMPSSLMHYSPEIHARPHDFDPERFLATELGGRGTQVASGTLRPFGGGGSYCPGRRFAERQVLGLVAGLVDAFEIRLLVEGEVRIPRNADFFFVTGCEAVEVEVSRRE